MLQQEITLAGKSYNFAEPGFKKGQELRRKMQAEINEIFGTLNVTNDSGKTIDVTELVAMAVDKSDSVLVWLSDYSAEVKKDVKHLEEFATLSELIEAVAVMIKQLFPLESFLKIVSRNGSVPQATSLN
jgi:gas vesicle protein